MRRLPAGHRGRPVKVSRKIWELICQLCTDLGPPDFLRKGATQIYRWMFQRRRRISDILFLWLTTIKFSSRVEDS